MRGTGRRGLSSLKSRVGLERPLLHIPKWQILDSAIANQLDWREDSTNQDQRYRRNFIRHNILTRFDYRHRRQLLELIHQLNQLDEQIETLLANQLHQQPASGVLDRHWFIMLPHAVAKEALAQWLRAHGVSGYDTRNLERLVTAAKTAQAGKVADVNNLVVLIIEADKLALRPRER